MSALDGRVCGLRCSMLLAACSNDPAGNAHVEYDGQTLVVDGTAYAREATFDPPGIDLPGRVVVQPADEKTDDALAPRRALRSGA